MDDGKKESLIVLRSRNGLDIDGVTDILSFDDTQLEVDTLVGRLCVDGEDLHVGELSVETGKLGLKGRINGLYYLSDEAGKKKRFGRKS